MVVDSRDSIWFQLFFCFVKRFLCFTQRKQYERHLIHAFAQFSRFCGNFLIRKLVKQLSNLKRAYILSPPLFPSIRGEQGLQMGRQIWPMNVACSLRGTGDWLSMTRVDLFKVRVLWQNDELSKKHGISCFCRSKHANSTR